MKDSLKYFVGKACTITVSAELNFRFKEEQMMDYFMGIVEQIDDYGIWITHVVTKCKTYIFLSRIVSISEEQMLFEDNPEHAKIIQEYRQEKPISAAKTAVTDKPSTGINPLSYVNPANLAKIAKDAKEAFKLEKK